MRTLHTFKGGSRLAGAMRVGEMAHRLETAIEHLARDEGVQAAQIEPLLARADAMSAAYEALRQAERRRRRCGRAGCRRGPGPARGGGAAG